MPTVQPLPANLASDCEDLTELEEGTGKAVMVWGLANIPKAAECKHKHAATRDAYNNVYGVLQEFQEKYGPKEKSK